MLSRGKVLVNMAIKYQPTEVDEIVVRKKGDKNIHPDVAFALFEKETDLEINVDESHTQLQTNENIQMIMLNDSSDKYSAKRGKVTILQNVILKSHHAARAEDSVTDSGSNPDWKIGSSDIRTNKDQSVIEEIDNPNINNKENVGDNKQLVNTVISGASEVKQHVKPKKRSRNSNNWLRNVKKFRLNSGQSYTNASGKLIRAKQLKPPCTERCRFKCTTNITEQQRQKLLDSYWRLGNLHFQREYLLRHLEKIQPKYRCAKTNRGNNYAFTFRVEDQKIRVCKKFFHATLNISDMMTRTVRRKLREDGILEADRRGTHVKRKISDEIKHNIRKHIESIPTIDSHYLRAQTNCKFFKGDLNLATLYRLYVATCTAEGKPVAKYFHYSHIFNYEYNIGFYNPKKDQCSKCEAYKNSSKEEQAELQTSYDKHQQNKVLAREAKRIDIEKAKGDNSILVAVYDMQAILPTPCSLVNDFFYKSKLSTFNFTIYNIPQKLGYCYVWDETIARRGVNEIGSFLMHFLKSTVDKKTIIFYSDNCCGQNKNKFVAATYLYAVNNFEISTITHKYLVVGHTQNEGDSMHSTIEKERRRFLKANKIYVPSQWIPIIATAKKTGAPYSIQEVEQADIYNIKAMTSQITNNFSTNTNGESVSWTNIKILHFDKEHPKSIFYKTNYNDEQFKEIVVDRNRRKKLSISDELKTLKNLYDSPIGISKKKKDGLLSLCEKKLMKAQYHSFYQNLPVEANQEQEEESSIQRDKNIPTNEDVFVVFYFC